MVSVSVSMSVPMPVSVSVSVPTPMPVVFFANAVFLIMVMLLVMSMIVTVFAVCISMSTFVIMAVVMFVAVLIVVISMMMSVLLLVFVVSLMSMPVPVPVPVPMPMPMPMFMFMFKRRFGIQGWIYVNFELVITKQTGGFRIDCIACFLILFKMGNCVLVTMSVTEEHLACAKRDEEAQPHHKMRQHCLVGNVGFFAAGVCVNEQVLQGGTEKYTGTERVGVAEKHVRIALHQCHCPRWNHCAEKADDSR